MSCIIDTTEYRKKVLAELRENQKEIDKKIFIMKVNNQIITNSIQGIKRALDNWQIGKL